MIGCLPGLRPSARASVRENGRFLAAAIPAFRAARVDPIVTLAE
jgi:hypothetical protein